MGSCYTGVVVIQPTVAIADVNMQKTVGVEVFRGVVLQPFGSAITAVRPPPDNYHVICLGIRLAYR